MHFFFASSFAANGTKTRFLFWGLALLYRELYVSAFIIFYLTLIAYYEFCKV